MHDMNSFAGICWGWRWWSAEKDPPPHTHQHHHHQPPPTPTNQSAAPHLLRLPVAWQRNVTASPACDWSAAFLGSPTHNALRAQSKHAFLLQPPTPTPLRPTSSYWGGHAPYHFDYIRRMRGQGMTLCNVKPIQCIQCVLLLFEDHKECLNVPFVPLRVLHLLLVCSQVVKWAMKTTHLYMNRGTVQTGSSALLHAPD